ncbi:hypothetical protein [Trinickia fusca]|uniref:hypothetical protein n=1 Tax=Trinickia fusca TaxID=2419777 RepID=UPI0011C3E576|nr:hypothetical protein [Trinickia fusca]
MAILEAGVAGGASQLLPPGIPGCQRQEQHKGDSVITDNATELDSSIKSGSLIYPIPDAKTVNDWITVILPDQAKGAGWQHSHAAGEQKVPAESGRAGNMKEFMNSP